MRYSDKLLLFIEEKSEDGQHWVYRLGTQEVWCNRLKEWINTAGPGRTSALRYLLDRGYIKQILATKGYAITEKGKVYAQTLA